MTINGGKKIDYQKNNMKIKFNSDDILPINKPLKFHLMTRRWCTLSTSFSR